MTIFCIYFTTYICNYLPRMVVCPGCVHLLKAGHQSGNLPDEPLVSFQIAIQQTRRCGDLSGHLSAVHVFVPASCSKLHRRGEPDELSPSRGATSPKKEEHLRALLKPAASQAAQEERRAVNRAVKVFALPRGFALDDCRDLTPALVAPKRASEQPRQAGLPDRLQSLVCRAASLSTGPEQQICTVFWGGWRTWCLPAGARRRTRDLRSAQLLQPLAVILGAMGKGSLHGRARGLEQPGDSHGIGVRALLSIGCHQIQLPSFRALKSLRDSTTVQQLRGRQLQITPQVFHRGSTWTDKNNLCSLWTNKLSQLVTFSQPSFINAFSNCLFHKSPASGCPYKFRSRGTTSMYSHLVLRIFMFWKLYPYIRTSWFGNFELFLCILHFYLRVCRYCVSCLSVTIR